LKKYEWRGELTNADFIFDVLCKSRIQNVANQVELIKAFVESHLVDRSLFVVIVIVDRSFFLVLVLEAKNAGMSKLVSANE